MIFKQCLLSILMVKRNVPFFVKKLCYFTNKQLGSCWVDQCINCMDIHRCIFLFWLLLILRFQRKTSSAFWAKSKQALLKYWTLNKMEFGQSHSSETSQLSGSKTCIVGVFMDKTHRLPYFPMRLCCYFPTTDRLVVNSWSRHIKKGSKSYLKSLFVKIGFEFFPITMFNMLCSLYKCVDVCVGRLNIKETTQLEYVIFLNSCFQIQLLCLTELKWKFCVGRGGERGKEGYRCCEIAYNSRRGKKRNSKIHKHVIQLLQYSFRLAYRARV